MRRLVVDDVRPHPLPRPGQADHANFALRCVLDAEIEALRSCLLQRSARAAVASGPARVDLDRQVGWLRAGLAKLQTHRDALS